MRDTGKWCTLMSEYEIHSLCEIEMRSKSIKISKDALDTFYLSFLMTDFISCSTSNFKSRCLFLSIQIIMLMTGTARARINQRALLLKSKVF